MKLLFITDIHGAFNQVTTLLAETVADLYIIGGDLIDIPFYNIETAINYHELQTFFHALRRKKNITDNIEDFVENLINDPKSSEEIQEKANHYLDYTIRARRVMQQKYKVLENIFQAKPQAKILALPGNYDMDLKYTSLHERDLHLHRYNIEENIIAGYGGAATWTAGIPEKFIVKYNANIGIDDKKNEMYNFFKSIKPDIIITHQPAHGIFDRLSFKGPSGSPALRTYCATHPVKLCLTGHIHNDWGFKYLDETIFLNPSNFGEVTTPKGEVSEGGFFYKIELNQNKVTKINFKKLVEDRVHNLVEYNLKGQKWKEDIIDQERFEARQREENYDLKVKKYSHIPEIELFKDIKQYFHMFQTEETEKRIDKLEEALVSLKGNYPDIALDIVGSVNMGTSQKNSDIDVVLYVRCDSNCPNMIEQCDHFKKTREIITQTLKKEYKFEIVDCLNLNIVEQSIIMENYECEMTQRFVTYRSICRPINYQVIAPIEDILNENIEFRKEMEGSIRSYLKIFVTTTRHIESFEKYETRLKAIGIKIPKYIKNKIKAYLQIEAR